MANSKSIRDQRCDKPRIPRRATSLSDLTDDELYGSRSRASSLHSPEPSRGRRRLTAPTLSDLDGDGDAPELNLFNALN